jgi:hypothetical protein
MVANMFFAFVPNVHFHSPPSEPYRFVLAFGDDDDWPSTSDAEPSEDNDGKPTTGTLRRRAATFVGRLKRRLMR